MKLLFRVRIVSAIFLLALPLPALANPDNYDRIRGDGTLLIGTDPTYPPFEYYNDQTRNLEGFDVDIISAVSSELGLKPEFIPVPFDAIISGLNSEKYDCVISALTITEDRSRAVLFSEPYYNAGQCIAVAVSNQDIKTVDDLSGRVIGVQLGTTGEILANKIADASVRSFDNIGDAFRDLANGNLDAIINDRPVSQAIIAARGKAKIIGVTLTDEKYGIAFRLGDMRLKEAVDIALKSLRTSGRYQQIHNKWLGADTAAAEDKSILSTYWSILKYLAPAIPMTIYITVFSFLIAFAFGLLIAIGRTSSISFFIFSARIYVDIIRGVPLLVIIFFIYFGLGFLFRLNEFWAGVIAIGLCYAAYMSETFRAGILAIPRGQREAGLSLGMTRWQVNRHIILPQSVRIVIPPLTNEFIACLKDSSLVSIIGLRELTRAGREYLSWSYIDFATWLTVGLIYLTLTALASRISRSIETRYRIPGMN